MRAVRNAREDGRRNDAMRRCDGEHVEPPQKVLHMDHRGEGDRHSLPSRQKPSVDAENNIQVFVSVAQQNLVECVLKKREDANTVPWRIGCGISASVKVVECTKILEPEKLNDAVSGAHRHIHPSRCFLCRRQEMLKR